MTDPHPPAQDHQPAEVRLREFVKNCRAGVPVRAQVADMIAEDIDAILALIQPTTGSGGEDAQPYKDALHDLVILKAQADIGCVPPPTREQWEKAWDEAVELTRVEP